GEDEAAYWGRLAQPAKVFSEYAGAFAFLFRAWAARGELSRAGPLIEVTPGWFDDVMSAFLIEQARTAYLPGRGSIAAEEAVRALTGTGGECTANLLFEVGYQLHETRWALTGTVCYRGCVHIHEELYRRQPDNVAIASGLGSALNNLGLQLSASGQT